LREAVNTETFDRGQAKSTLDSKSNTIYVDDDDSGRQDGTNSSVGPTHLQSMRN